MGELQSKYMSAECKPFINTDTTPPWDSEAMIAREYCNQFSDLSTGKCDNKSKDVGDIRFPCTSSAAPAASSFMNLSRRDTERYGQIGLGILLLFALYIWVRQSDACKDLRKTLKKCFPCLF